MLATNYRVKIEVDVNNMPDVPAEKVPAVIGELLLRAARWESADEVAIVNDEKNHLLMVIWDKDERHLITIGAVWRNENREFTFHS